MQAAMESTMIRPEKVAYWFFRLNGCLTIVNFIVHPDLVRPDEPRSQRTDVDILAVRFPYRSELLTSGKPMRDHECFNSTGLIDLVIGEAKHGRCRLNGPWTRPPNQNMHRVLYAMGAFDAYHVPTVAESLYRDGYYSDDEFRVRLFALGAEKNDGLLRRVVQLTWEEILRFIHYRLTTYRAHKAQHDQWDSDGKRLYRLSASSSADEFVATVKASMENYVQAGKRLA